MSEHKPALQEHLGQIPQAQLVPQPPEHHLQDDIGGIFQVIEKRSCAFVEGSTTLWAPEGPVLVFLARSAASVDAQ